MTRDPKCAATEGTGLTAMTNLPPSLLCKRTGLAAGTEGSCGQCDSCLWVAAMEQDLRQGEEDPTDEQ